MLRASSPPVPPIRTPATVPVPAVAVASPARRRRVVVLPAPLGPRKPKTLPLGTVRFRFSRATTPWAYRLLRPVVEMAASVPAVSRGHVARMRAIDSAGAALTPAGPAGLGAAQFVTADEEVDQRPDDVDEGDDEGPDDLVAPNPAILLEEVVQGVEHQPDLDDQERHHHQGDRRGIHGASFACRRRRAPRPSERGRRPPLRRRRVCGSSKGPAEAGPVGRGPPSRATRGRWSRTRSPATGLHRGRRAASPATRG